MPLTVYIYNTCASYLHIFIHMPLIYMALIATYAMQYKIAETWRNLFAISVRHIHGGHTFVNKYLITGRIKATALVCKLLLKNMCLYIAVNFVSIGKPKKATYVFDKAFDLQIFSTRLTREIDL